ncbi:MAG: class I SAM-dependent methyltransferase [Candidatus Latescibacteria bacterium]|nr:class I SAM-dependent methyltransferase [Candidatus Latescibacterota bacterium]
MLLCEVCPFAFHEDRMDEQDVWFRRFFGEEYLLFDEHPDTAQEVAFISEALRLTPRMRLLDLCCGYGRHGVPLARQGFHVVGLDLSPVLLKEARKRQKADGRPKRKSRESRVASRESKAQGQTRDPRPVTRDSTGGGLHLVRGDVRHLPFAGGFDAAISMFTSLGYFDDEAENFRVLKGIAGVLKPGGSILIETVNRDAIVRHFRPVQVFRPTGMTVIEERQFDLVSGRSRVDVTVIRDGQETRLHHSIRVYAFTELEMLLMANGLNVEGVWGDFQGGEFSWNTASMIVLARKV